MTRDTVEEFWDLDLVDGMLAAGDGTDPAAFAERFAEQFRLSGRPVLRVSARDALRAYLAARRWPAERRTVLISAFNCAAVADAVRAAGLVPVTFDSGAAFGAMDPAAVLPLLEGDVAAVVVPHLFGAPADLRPLLAPCRERGIAVVEDCSQTAGAMLDGRPVGSFGDATIFSFGYDKPLSLGGGGLLLSRDGTTVEPDHGHIAADRRLLSMLVNFLQRRRALVRRTGAVTSPSLRRRLYARAADAPAPVAVGPLRARLGMWQLDRYDEIRGRRNANADRLATSGLVTWPVPAGGAAAWLKQKVLLSGPAAVDLVSRRLQRDGLRVGPFNWMTIVADERPAAVACHRAAHYARCSVDVPIHQRVTDGELSHMAQVLNAVTP